MHSRTLCSPTPTEDRRQMIMATTGVAMMTTTLPKPPWGVQNRPTSLVAPNLHTIFSYNYHLDTLQDHFILE